MTGDPSSSIPSGDKKEQPAPVEEVVSECVNHWVRTKRRLKPLTPTELEKTADQLGVELGKTLKEEAPDDLYTAIKLELKHQIREATESKEGRTRRIRTLVDFLDEDLRSAVKAGVEKAAEAKAREPHLLGPIAEETNLEIHQVLLHAKKEFSDSSSSIHIPIVREAVLCKVQALEQETTVEKITGELAKGLGIPFVARVRRQLQNSKEKDHIAALLDAAGHQAARQFEHPLVQAQVLDELRHLRAAFLA